MFFLLSLALGSLVSLLVFVAIEALAFLALLARADLRSSAARWRALNLSTRPSMSMTFFSPV